MGRVALRVVAATMVAVSVVIAAAVAKPHDPFQRTLGVYMGDHASRGLCPVMPPATERRCTVAPTDREFEEDDYGTYPHVAGRIVLLRMLAGTPTPATKSISVRFRVIRGPHGPGGPASRWFELRRGNFPPQRKKELHEFPVHVPFLPGDRLALDVIVHGDGTGEAAAPIAEESTAPVNTAEWSPPLQGRKLAPRIWTGRSLAMNVVFERNDQTPPELRWNYAPRQDFLNTRRIYVRVHSNEKSHLNPECVLDAGDSGWGMLANEPHFPPGGGWATYICEGEPRAIRAGRKAYRAGKNVDVRVRLRGWDPANNYVSEKTFYVRPTRP